MASTTTKAKSKTSTKNATRKTAKKTARKAATPKVREGAIAHTELASADPAATKTWAKNALGWKFAPPMPSPVGDYHMWDSHGESGGIRNVNAPETPGTLIYVEVADIKRAYAKALQHGAKPMMPPEAIGGGMGRMAVVHAPGGVPIGLWSAK